MKNNLPTVSLVRHRVRRIWAGALGALLCAWAAAPALAAPAPGVSCVASAQNRNTPLTATGDYVLDNLPGSGIAPFGVGAHAQPFRVRVTCNDGSVGESPLVFPAFEQQLITPAPIVWGLKTPVPTALRLEFPRNTIGADRQISASVVASYASGGDKIVTAHATGTGYRSSAAGFVGVDENGRVFLQGSSFQTFAGMMPIPGFITITAENDGVTASRVLKLVGPSQFAGRVFQSDGKSAANLEVRLSIPGYPEMLVRTDASGDYRFAELPFVASRSAQLTVVDRANRRVASAPVSFQHNGYAQAPSLRLGGPGLVRVTVVDAAGAPQPGVEVGVTDAYARAVQEGGALPMQRTDANGQIYVDNVAAGEVTVISGSVGYAPEPGAAELESGGFVPFVLRGGAPTPAEGAALVGDVLQMPDRSPAVGFSVELAREATGMPLRQLLDGNGNYAFRGLAPNADYRLLIKLGAETVQERWIRSAPSGREGRADFLLNQQLGMTGLVVAKDGVTPVAGASLQASWYDDSIRAWRLAATATSRNDGAFAWRYLEARAYRVEALGANGASGRTDVDLRGAAPGTLQSVRIQLGDRAVQTRLGLRASVLGAANYGALDAALFVKNSRCSSGCVLGVLRSAGERLETELLPQGRNEFELRWRGRTQSFAIEVNEATDGQTLERVIDFGAETSGVNRIAQQRSLFSFDAAAGELIDATVLGIAAEGASPARAIRVELYGPDGAKLGEGRGFDPAHSTAPAAQALRGALAQASGRHTLVVSPLTTDALNLGAYGMLVTVAERPTLAQGWTSAAPARFGAQLGGRVSKRNGAAAPGTPVLVRAGAADKIQLFEQVVADAEGAFAHMNAPLGPVELSVAAEGGLLLAKAQGSLAADGEQLVRDLQLAARTRLALSVRLTEALLNEAPIGTLPVQLSDELNERRVDLVFEPASARASIETAVAGDRALIKLAHPRNPRIAVEREIVGDDEALVELEIGMATGGVTGRVMSATGDPVSVAEVFALGADGRLLEQAAVDAEARFAFKVLPADAAIRLRARDGELEIETADEVLVREGVQVSADDLVLPTAAVTGSVLFENGAPVGGVAVEASFGAASSRQAQTDGQGRYQFARVPADRNVTITAFHPASGQQATVEVRAASGERVEAPEIYLEIVGASVSGLVRNVGGRPLEGVRVVVSNSGERASCSGWEGGDPWVPAARRRAAVRPVSANDGDFSASGVTDAQGRFYISNVQQGPMVVSAAMGLNCQLLEREIEVGAPGSNVSVGEFVFPDLGSVLLRIVDPAGQVLDVPNRYGGECPVRLILSGPDIDQLSLPLPALAGTRVEGVPFGTYMADLRECSDALGRGQVEVRDASRVNFDVVVPVLKGRVFHADGTPVTNGYVTLSQRDGLDGHVEISSGLEGRDMYGNPAEPGTYVLYGRFKTGKHELRVQEYDNGLRLRRVGTFSQLPTEPLDLTLPVTAQLQGCITQSDGRPAAATRVTAFNEGLIGGYRMIGSRDVDVTGGCYRFDRIPAGETVLHAFEGEELRLVQTFQLAPLSDKAPLQRNLQYPVLGRAIVRATTMEGQPMYNQRLILQPQQIEQGLSYSSKELRSAGNGYATFNLMPGPYKANHTSPHWNDEKLGRTDMRIDTGATVEAAVTYGGAYKFGGTQDAPTVPDGTAGYMFNGEGRLVSAGQVGNFTSWSGPQLLINGMPMPTSMGMDYQRGARVMALGPFEYANRLAIKRQLYVPASGGYARQLETLTNRSAQSITVRVEIVGQNDFYCEKVRITEPQNSAERGYVGYEDCEVAAAHIYGGAGVAAGTVKASQVDLDADRGTLTQWLLTLAPGQSAAIMHFYAMASTADAAALATRAAALTRLAEPDMLDGLTAEDRQNIRNFAIGQ